MSTMDVDELLAPILAGVKESTAALPAIAAGTLPALDLYARAARRRSTMVRPPRWFAPWRQDRRFTIVVKDAE